MYHIVIFRLDMSWAADEWKDGLPAKALQKINQLETQFERLKKEREQKQYQLDSLEQVCLLRLSVCDWYW